MRARNYVHIHIHSNFNAQETNPALPQQGCDLLTARLHMLAQCFDYEKCTVEPGIENLLLQLIQLVDMLEFTVGNEALWTVRRQLRELDATSAMDALKLLQWCTTSCDAADPNLCAMRDTVVYSGRRMRDVVAMFFVNRGGAKAAFRCHRQARGVFLGIAEGFKGEPLDIDFRAKLLLAYHKLKKRRAEMLERYGAVATIQDWVRRWMSPGSKR